MKEQVSEVEKVYVNAMVLEIYALRRAKSWRIIIQNGTAGCFAITAVFPSQKNFSQNLGFQLNLKK